MSFTGYNDIGYHISDFKIYLPGETQVVRAPLYEAYIPSSIARVSDIPSGGSTYTAGNGISIYNNEISIDENVVATKSDIPESYGDENVSSYLQYHFGLYDGSSTTDVNSSDYSVDSTGTLTITSGWTPDPNAVVELNADDGNGNGTQVCQFELQYNDNTNLYEATASVENYSDFTLEYNENTGETTLQYDWEFFNDNSFPIFHFTQWITVESYDTLNDKYIPNTIARVADLEDELPDYSNASAGDVLAVDSNGDLEWTTPSSGGGSSGSVKIFPVNGTNYNHLNQNTELTTLVNNICNGTITDVPPISIKAPNGNIFDLVAYDTSTNFKSFAFYCAGNNQYISYGFYGGSWFSKDIDTSNYFAKYPSMTGNAGKVLAVNSSGNSVEWTTPSVVPTSQANAVSAIYLKDTNDQVYEITVDTNGTLTATAVV